jgi:uncharacterized membrane protein YjdF
MKKEVLDKIIVGVTIFILVALEFYSVTTDSHYKWDFFFLLGLLFLVYGFRKKLRLHTFHLFLLAIFLVVHNLGTFGLYRNFYFGVEYDLYVHAFFGLLSSLILFRAYGMDVKKKPWYFVLMILGLTLGMSAFHELFEAAGALVLGKGEGVLFMGAGDIDEFDTQKDMLMNLIGAIVGVSGYFVFGRIRDAVKKKKSNEDIEEKKAAIGEELED